MAGASVQSEADYVVAHLERGQTCEMEVAAPVFVPKTLRNAHAVAKSVLDSPSDYGLTKPVARRAALLVQGLIAAMDKHDWTIQLSTERRRFAVVRWSSHEVELNIKELKTRAEHIPTKAELIQKEKWQWHQIPEYHHTPDGRLQISIGPSWSGKKFADGKRVRLEDRLGVVIEAIRVQFDGLEQQRIAHQRREELRQQQRKTAMERAVEIHRESERLVILNGEIASWQRAAQMRAYADVLEVRFGRAATEWTGWIREKADELDPLRADAHGVPEIPIAGPSELTAYMPVGLSPWA